MLCSASLQSVLLQAVHKPVIAATSQNLSNNSIDRLNNNSFPVGAQAQPEPETTKNTALKSASAGDEQKKEAFPQRGKTFFGGQQTVY
jgi:hypothetical protein